ncbi:hypothetical protein BFS06_13870 [Clostridium perfringens]|uniref:leucine-rich repeat domain-containing protein n=1 Tax=Clostridium perfringens TaxID=1502 RepID=UPI00103E27F8|nr:leucine-rich repeat domain-containing protein [Clostridium perfringens]TBX14293.1 hypothetical protein BFS06_13870 [Clostridium perfringens]
MKKSKIENLLHSKGYVSIETLIVAGLVIATGTFLISKLVLKGKDVANSNNKNIATASKTMDDNSFSNNISTDQSQLVKEEKSKHTLEKTADLTDFDYAIIDDNYINGELKKIDEKTSQESGPFAPPPEVINDMKYPIQKLKEFKGGIIITGYHGNKTDIEIPSYIDDKEVVAIAPMAFAPIASAPKPTKPSKLKKRNCIFRLKSVKLPNTLKFIGDNAFTFNQLTNIAIPDSVIEIGRCAFGSNTLTSIKLPNSITKLYCGTFENNKLTSVIIPDSVTEIEYGVFENNNLTSIKLGSNLKRIGRNAFSGNKLELATIPDSVIEIDECAFSKNNLTSIKLGSNLKKIEDFAFLDNKLTSVIIPDSVTDLSDSAFIFNPLKTKIIPKTCKEAKLPTLKMHK